MKIRDRLTRAFFLSSQSSRSVTVQTFLSEKISTASPDIVPLNCIYTDRRYEMMCRSVRSISIKRDFLIETLSRSGSICENGASVGLAGRTENRTIIPNGSTQGFHIAGKRSNGRMVALAASSVAAATTTATATATATLAAGTAALASENDPSR
ncbi:hypothetical protein V1478_004056, partial [Vespula squamosa]